MRSQSSVAETDAIRSHLEHVLQSREFSAAPRLGRFLTFVVETMLEGLGDQIKETLIAVEVYGRRPDYNPQIDSTVRVEAGRLRQRLQQYYDSHGSGDAIRIELPKGTYAPIFHFGAQSSPLPDPIGDAPPEEREQPSRGPQLLAAVVLIAVCVAAYLGSRSAAASTSKIDSIAVLPFVHLGQGELTGRFADSLTEDLTSSLARETRVRVPARTIMVQYKNQTVDMRRIGKDHGVRAVLTGTVRNDGGRLVVTTQLIDTRNGYHLWSDRYERTSVEAGATEDEIARKIVSGLRPAVRGDAAPRAEQVADAKASEMYHRARELLRIPVLKSGVPEKLPDTVVESVRLFEQVTTRNPHFAKGWAGLAEAYEWEYELQGNRPPERLAQAKAAAVRATQLEPDLIEGWTILTSILFFREWDFAGAETAVKRTIELDPRNTAARQRYIDLLRVQNRTKEAELETDRAVQLLPAAAALRARRALLLHESGNHDEALRQAAAAAELTNQMPVYPITLWVQGRSLEQKGRVEEAERTFRSALAFQPHDPWNEPALGHLLARTNRTAEAEAILQELRSQLARGRLTHVAMAVVYTGLGRKHDALAALERGWNERDDSILLMARDPRLKPLHSEERFQSILTRLRFNTAS